MKIIRCMIVYVWGAAFGMVTYFPPGWAQPVTRLKLSYAPWGGSISVPSSSLEGVIVARAQVPVDWMSLCGEPSCEISGVTLYSRGDGVTPITGPDITSRNPGLKMQVLFDGQPVTTSSIGVKPSRVELIAIRTASPLNTNPLAFITTSGMTVFTVSGGSSFSVNAGQGATTLIAGTCKVPDKTVTLPRSLVYHFRGVGTTTEVAVPFELEINACPPGFNHVGYTLSAIGAVQSSANGVLPLAPDATASGVAIQLVDPSGTPIQLNTPMNVTAYDKTTGGSFGIPLVARYVQTADTIGPGSVTGAVEVLMDYY
ncbi:hypothetical protein QZN01_04025 [Burkholderia cenocepacia]|uniref:fimbrial protein n=1 Tax=Burkholderia cenocepacia TaxID=95486 RepID=UPI00264EF6A1|nr:fimbrial protein [Burkholderia cenocepacia]MDI9647357.1 hypothetical protein [Burkholderia cenocepacia]MDN7821806.1 hypothetical protein [Burkholderia cenocepacia]HEM9001277.1 type 1 fimbrial protein [Burkholderia cenocepacia]